MSFLMQIKNFTYKYLKQITAVLQLKQGDLGPGLFLV